MVHRIFRPRRRLVFVTRCARVGDAVLVGHHRGDHTKRVSMDKSSGNTFALNRRHVAGNAVASRAAILVVTVLFEARSVRPVRG